MNSCTVLDISLHTTEIKRDGKANLARHFPWTCTPMLQLNIPRSLHISCQIPHMYISITGTARLISPIYSFKSYIIQTIKFLGNDTHTSRTIYIYIHIYIYIYPVTLLAPTVSSYWTAFPIQIIYCSFCTHFQVVLTVVSSCSRFSASYPPKLCLGMENLF